MEEFDKSISFDGRDIRLKIGLLAPQAGGSVLIQSGETAVLVTATTAKAREGVDFLPLTVDYEERLYAAGRIPGGFLRREGRPPEKAILTGRLIDRPLRPLFPSWMRDDIQVVATTLSMDEEVPPDVLAVTGASVAVLLAGIPFQGPMAAVRVGLLGDEFIINPTYKEIHNGELDLVVAGSPEGVVMIEAGANQLPERDIIEAIDFGYEAVRDLITAQRELIDQLGIPLVTREAPVVNETVQNFLREQAKEEIKQILCQFTLSKTERDEKLEAIENRIKETITALPDEDPLKAPTLEEPKLIGNLFKDLTKKLMRAQIIEDGVRVDGRKLDEVRPISCLVGVLPRRVHGSGLFNRGLTQVLSIATLGTPGDAQDLGDDLHPEDEKRYLHHYNFPPFSVGETRPMRSPGRREIGHGALAERAIVPVLPPQEEFPYVLRVVSEVLSSNGSTSMGSVCGSTLALMDAGVPLKKPVSGAAMGLIKEGEEVRILTDIQGIEDFLGDMDFKVAGTDSGITALQMDMKIPGLSMEVVAKAIEQALPARKHILEKMLATLEKPRTELSPHAPRLLTIKIDPDLIGLVIGPGGKTVKGITEQTGTKIDIDDDGTVTISSTDGEQAEKAKRLMLVKVREIDSKGRLNLTRLGIHPDEAAAARKAATVV